MYNPCSASYTNYYIWMKAKSGLNLDLVPSMSYIFNILLKYIHDLLQGLATLVLWRATTEFSSIPNQTHLKNLTFGSSGLLENYRQVCFVALICSILSEKKTKIIGAVPFPKPFYFINPSNVHKVHISTLSVHIST